VARAMVSGVKHSQRTQKATALEQQTAQSQNFSAEHSNRTLPRGRIAVVASPTNGVLSGDPIF